MHTRAFRMNLDPGQEQQYLRRHDEIWPELVTLLRGAGIKDYRIFLDPESHALFAVMTHQEEHGLDDLPQHPVMQRWWQYMKDIMPSQADGSPCSVELKPMFDLPRL
ncbi:L-rhamnose mutarotase [Pseudomonas protegens]|uniref:L-rhamnose mutarotase n=1 Tax=Pseudomonas protegens TaxID=380021 RepID=UPI00390614E9